MKRLALQLAATLVSFGIMGLFPGIVKAVDTVFIVDTLNHTADANTSDDLCADSNGDCSLRAAIQQSSSNYIANPVVINFDPGVTGTITLTSPLGDITNDVTINGPGSDVLTLDMNANESFSLIYPYWFAQLITVNINGLTFKDGYGLDGEAGCLSVISKDATLNLDDIVFDHCRNADTVADTGGAILSRGELNITNSTFKNNQNERSGGALRLNNSVTITNSVFHNNTAEEDGGAVSYWYSGAHNIIIENTTFFENIAGEHGGAIDLYDIPSDISTAELNNVTIYANVADYDGNNNGNGGGVSIYRTNVVVKNSIIADNLDLSVGGTQNNECSGDTLTSEGYNLIKNDCTNISGALGTNITGEDPLFAYPRAEGGNGTTVLALLEGSPAIDAGDPTGCDDSTDTALTEDQRGSTRPVNGTCDIGAFEGSVTAYKYYYPAYRHEAPDKLAWLNFGNSSDTDYASVKIYTGTNSKGTYWLQPEEKKTFTFPGVAGELLTVISDRPLYTTLKTEVLGTINEFEGISDANLSTTYYYPAYRWENPDKKAWINVGNPSDDTTANVEIFIGGVSRGTYPILPGERISEKFEDAVGQQVEIVSDIPVYSTLKTLVNGFGNEFPGITQEQLSTQYYFPAYRWENPDKKAWVIIGNPSTTTTANVEIIVGGISQGTFPVAPGDRISPTFTDALGEQVELNSDIDIYATLKMRVGDAGDEFAGISALGQEFYYPWYEFESPDLKSWIIIGNPGGVTANVDVYLDGAFKETVMVAAGTRVSLSYPEEVGPTVVRLVSDQDVYTTLKMVENGSLNEYPGVDF